FLNLGIHIHTRKTSRAVMVTGGEVNDHPLLRLVRVAIHANNKFAIVDAVLSLVEKQPGATWAWVNDVAHVLVLPESAAKGIHICGIEPGVHGNAAHPRIRRALNLDRAIICRAFPDA